MSQFMHALFRSLAKGHSAENLRLSCLDFIHRPRRFTLHSRSGELRTQKLKSHLVRTQSLNVLPFKPGVGQYIACLLYTSDAADE